MSKKQSTLFQSWGQKKKEPNETKKQSGQGRSRLGASEGVIDLCLDEDDEDDDLLAQALEASVIDAGHTENVMDKSPTNNPGPSTSSAADVDDVCNISIGAETFSNTQGFCSQTNVPEGFDKFAGKLWIYPTNYPVREYQYSIVKQSLFNNTMVTLPTGLGKTFIASVVMYNFYRWYPLGKVVFMAPTKPLVAQQIEACYNIMGIPQTDTAEMTGNMPPQERRKAWNDKRVFFLTPQVLTNDLSRGTCPAVSVKCLVVDEAHKATGNHAYCQVVRELVKYTQEFRILALSATPGSDIKAVQQVLGNLLISHIEIRTEDSPDIKQYSHERKVEKIVVPLGDELTLVKTKYLQIMDVVVGRLKRQGVIYNRDTKSLSKFLILKAREAFRQNPPERVQRSQFGMIEGDFALAMSLFHGYELLQLHGLRSLYNFLDGIVSGDKGHGRTRTELMKNADFNSLMEMLQEKFLPAECRPSQASQSSKKPFVTGHPKMEKLKEVVLEHFDKFLKAEKNKDRATRIMIFSQYRDSVTEIKDMLKQHYPIVKVMSFIGQSSAGKATKGFTQKEQLKVMKEFRDGGYNTLVSTCVGEEGLDIGEVDLIICFDAHKSPIRLVQRMGRTGRKREGRIVMLVTQGKEEQIYNQSQYSKKSIHKAILNGAKSLNFYQFNARMVPDGWDPKCHKMFITVKETFKPAKADEKNKITKMLNTNTDRKAAHSVDDGLLTEEQYKVWKQNYEVPKEELKMLKPKSKFLSLSTEAEASSEDGDNKSEKYLSLNKWLLWQNRLQTSYVMGHSERSKHLVELVEFIELQESLDPIEDNYGQEMELFLNKDDIIKPGEGIQNDGGKITSFLTTAKTTNPNKKVPKKKVVRRSNLLRDFESDKEQEDSDVEFPAVGLHSEDVDIAEIERETTENGNSLQQLADTVVGIDKVTKCQSKEKVNVEKEKHPEKEGTNIDELGFKSGINKIKRKSTKKLQENKIVEETLAQNDYNNKMKTKGKKKDKKKRYSSGNATIVQIIANDDGSDFDDDNNNNGFVPDIPVEVDTGNQELIENNVEQQSDDNVKLSEPMTAGNINNSHDVVNMEIDGHDCEKQDECHTYDPTYSQLFPMFEDSKSVFWKSPSRDRACMTEYQIPSPPSVEEIKVVIESLDNSEHLPKINLEELVEEWKNENHFSKKETLSEEIKPAGLVQGQTKNGEKSKMSDVDCISYSPLVDKNVTLVKQNEVETYRTLSNLVVNQSNGEIKDDLSDSNYEDYQNCDTSRIENPEVSHEYSAQKLVNVSKSDHVKKKLSDESSIQNLSFVDKTLGSEKKLCDENNVQKYLPVDQVEKLSSDSDNEDIFIDTQANFMLTADDHFLGDMSMDDGHHKSLSVSNSSFDHKSDNSSVVSHPEDTIDKRKSDSKEDAEIGDINVTKLKKPLFKDLSLSKIKESADVMEERATFKHKAFIYPSSHEKFSSEKTVTNANSSVKNQLDPEPDVDKVNSKFVSKVSKDSGKCELIDSKNTDKHFVLANNFQMSKKDLLNTSNQQTPGHATNVSASVNASNQQTPGHATNVSASLFDDSLFKDELSDDTFLTVKTPHSSNKPNIKNSDLDSQVTFTQALACVHSGSEGSSTDDTHIQEIMDEKSSNSDHSSSIKVDKNIAQTEKSSRHTDGLGGSSNLDDFSKTKHSPSNLNLNQTSDVILKQGLAEQKQIDNQCFTELRNSCVKEKAGFSGNIDGDDHDDDEEEEEEVDLPTFDLGFNIDEDIIPPSPCTSPSFSQKSFSRSLSQSLIRSRKSLSTLLGTSVDEKKSSSNKSNKNKMIPITEESLHHSENCEDNENGDIQLKSVLRESESCMSVNVNSKNDSDTSDRVAVDNKKEKITQNLDDDNENCDLNTFSEKETDLEFSVNFDCDITFDNLEGPSSPVLSGRKLSILKNSPESPALNDSLVVRKKRRVTMIDSPETPGCEKQELDKSLDDSFVVRKKHKVSIIDSPETPDLCNKSSTKEDEFEFKTPVRPVLSKRKSKMIISDNSDDDIDTTRLKERKKLSVSFRDMTTTKIIDDYDDEDFQDDGKLGKDVSKNINKVREGRKKEKSATVSNENRYQQKKFTNIKPRKSKSPADMFIVDEADVSDEDDVDISDDEADDSDLDNMEDSFIHEGSQLSQDCSQDMHAIYLKSVRSPAVSSGNRFKLKYDHGNIDVFSQVPRGEDEEESQYIDDSFCVDDDYEDTMIDIDEEVELCKDLNDTTFVGRRTRWSKPVRKETKKVVKTDKRMKRIRTMVDSSSDEETHKLGHVSNVTTCMSPAESPKGSTSFKPRKRQILSSSDDDGLLTKSTSSETSPEILSLRSRVGHGGNITAKSGGKDLPKHPQSFESEEPQMETPGDNASQEIMLSLKSRISKTGNTKALSVLSNQPKRSSGDRKGVYTDIKTSISNSKHNVSGNGDDNCSLADKMKEERLKKQKEKQEEFKRKMAEKQNMTLKNQGDGSDEIKTAKGDNSIENVSGVVSAENESAHLERVSRLHCSSAGKLVILVDSKELNGAQDIVSDLRFLHNSVVVAAQLLGCDYVVSNRMGVDRQQWAEFSNGTNRNKLTEKIQNMCELYDRPCLLIEKDRIKGDVKSGSSRPLHWTKYVDRTLAQLIKSKVTLYFTESQKETAAMLAELCKLEQRKNLSISVPTDLNVEKQQQAKFYCSFPSLSYIHSLNLCYNFTSISQFLSSDVDNIRNKGKMSEKRATEVYNYIRRTFDTQMLPTSYG